MGNCYRQIKKYQKSIEHLIVACEKKKDEAPAHNNLGLSYFEDQQYELALDRFTKAIEFDE
jgi:tetratricopeptide (TPR) repeat protein